MKGITDKELNELMRVKPKTLDTTDNFFSPDMEDTVAEQYQCFGKQDENRAEEDLDDWLDGQID